MRKLGSNRVWICWIKKSQLEDEESAISLGADQRRAILKMSGLWSLPDAGESEELTMDDFDLPIGDTALRDRKPKRMMMVAPGMWCTVIRAMRIKCVTTWNSASKPWG